MNKIFFFYILIAGLVFQACNTPQEAQQATTQIPNQDFRKSAPTPGPAPKIELGTYEEFKLDNGLTVIVVENHKIPRVSFQLTVDLPLIYEGEYAGAASMAGGLLTTGTTKRTKAEIDETIDFYGASLGSGAGGLFGSSLTKYREQMLDIMSDVLTNPSFPEPEFEKLKKQTISGVVSSKENPSAISGNIRSVVNFGKDHPYGELTTEETLEKVTLEKCREFYDTYFKPDISFLAIVGDITLTDAKTLARKYFGAWKSGTVEKKNYPVPQKPEATTVHFAHKSGVPQSILTLTHPIEIKQGHPDWVKLAMMRDIMGASLSGRMDQNIREDKGYTYGTTFSVNPDQHIGTFSTGASVRNEVTDSALIQFLYELNRLRDEKVGAEELQRVKNYRTGAFARQLERPQTIAQYALNTARYKLPKDYYATYLEKVSQVTIEDIQAMAQKYIDPSRLNITVVGDKDQVAEKLKAFSKDGEIKFYDFYGEPVDYSGTAMPADLTAEKVLEDYINAIGGTEKIKMVEDVTMKMSTSIQGMNMEMVLQQKKPNKLSTSATMQGMNVMSTKFDGEKGELAQMGNKQPLEGSVLEDTKRQAMLFAESKYGELGYKMSLKGIEPIDGNKAYKIELETPSGTKFTEFYDMSSSLKLRTVTSQEGPTGAVTITVDFANYKEVEGVKFPHVQTTSGIMPMPLKMEVKSIEVNKGIDDSVFKIE